MMDRARATTFTGKRFDPPPVVPLSQAPDDGTLNQPGGRFAHPRRCRIALYSHDTMGLGHMRRNLLIAQRLNSSHLHATVLLIAGAREASAFAMPFGVDCLTLPGLRKEMDGRYLSRCLDVSLEAVTAVRSRAIRAAVEAFEPDVLIVDNVPRGAVRELDVTLDYLGTARRTRCVLGMRDVLDDPVTVSLEWHRAGNTEAVRDYYDAIFVYGDPAVFDPVHEYGFNQVVASKVRYAGYLDRRVPLKQEDEENEIASTPPAPSEPFVLCMVGGGQDGAHLAEAFAHTDLPPGTEGLLLAGPFMPREVLRRLERRAARNSRLTVIDFDPEPTHLLSRADRVIAMGGYNTVSEILSSEKPALIVPRVSPRREQLVRAERMRDLGLFDMLHPDNVSPATIGEWLAREVAPSPRVRDRIDMNGLDRLPHLLEEVLAAPHRGIHSPCLKGGIRHVTY
jgi:predicted glycosyltransferase